MRSQRVNISSRRVFCRLRLPILTPRAMCFIRSFDCIRALFVPQPTERQRIGNQIDAALVFAWADFVNVLWASHDTGQRLASSPWLGLMVGFKPQFVQQPGELFRARWNGARFHVQRE